MIVTSQRVSCAGLAAMLTLDRADRVMLLQRQGAKKERLLNPALAPHCDQVMWIDADVIVPDPLWREEVSRALDQAAVVQPFSIIHQLAPPGLRLPRRQSTVAAMRIDPLKDLALGENGAWQWGSNRPELHQYVADYFASRNEDADPAEIALS
jgi:hypothetical protein